MTGFSGIGGFGGWGGFSNFGGGHGHGAKGAGHSSGHGFGHNFHSSPWTSPPKWPSYQPPSPPPWSDPEPSGDRYRTMDGSDNNQQSTEWGSTGSELQRMAESDYADNQGGMAGEDRPSGREISNAVMEQETDTPNEKNASDLFWQWGQFIDHDITLVETGDESVPVSIPEGDPWFDPTGTGEEEMPFTRSETSDGKEQTNSISSYLDGSMLYGSDVETMNDLRSFEGGAMKIDDEGLLPRDEDGNFMSGDVRVNEQSGLTSMHTLWVREHNLQAEQISADHPTWSDETVFQEARRVVSAEIQHITYEEYLPLLVGEEAMSDYQGYDSSVDATISNEFATAAYRFGHSMLSPTLLRLDADGEEIPEGHLSLADAFFQPDSTAEAGIDPIIRGQATQVAQELDPMVIDEVRNLLFGPPGAGGLDLAALNIQRGRDHGLPSYNDTREALGYDRVESFDDAVFQDGYGAKLASVYNSVDEIDLWVGGLAENAKGTGMVGETFQTILVDQFERLRSGDRYWYEAQMSGQELAEVKSTSLADVIERNTDVEIDDDTAMTAPQETEPDQGNGNDPWWSNPQDNDPWQWLSFTPPPSPVINFGFGWNSFSWGNQNSYNQQNSYSQANTGWNWGAWG